MAGFVKFHTSILESTLWEDPDLFRLFATALLMAAPREIKEPTPAISIRNLELTGFVVQPGWYGFVSSAGIGIVSRALMSREVGMTKLEALASPDPESRTPAHEGRRMVRISGGFVVLNYMLYRERDDTAADRMRRYRMTKKLEADAVARERAEGVTSDDRNDTRNVTEETRHVTHAEADGEADQDPDPSRARAIAGVWPAATWYSRYAAAWCREYRTVSYGMGKQDAIATGELSQLLGTLTITDLLSAQSRATAMIADFLSEQGKASEARHPWLWFVRRFNGARVPRRGGSSRGGKGGPNTTRDAFAEALGVDKHGQD